MRLTADDYRLTPDGPPWLELLDGQLVGEPSPTFDHQYAALELAVILRSWAKRGSRAQVLVAPFDVFLSAYDVVQPDVLLILNERWSIIRSDGVYGAPDLVVEVLSPSTEGFDRTQKRDVYARSGVGEMWVVDPALRTVSAWRFAENATLPLQVLGPGQTLTSNLLPGLEVNVAEIFGPLSSAGCPFPS